MCYHQEWFPSKLRRLKRYQLMVTLNTPLSEGEMAQYRYLTWLASNVLWRCMAALVHHQLAVLNVSCPFCPTDLRVTRSTTTDGKAHYQFHLLARLWRRRLTAGSSLAHKALWPHYGGGYLFSKRFTAGKRSATLGRRVRLGGCLIDCPSCARFKKRHLGASATLRPSLGARQTIPETQRR